MTAPQKLETLLCGAKTRALENAVWKQDKCKRQTSPAEQGARGLATKKRAPSTKVSKTPHKQSLGQKPLTLKCQRIESESEASDHDSFSEGDKKEHEQSDVDSDDAQHNVHDAGADSDHDSDSDAAGLNDSEDDDLDAAARMLSDEEMSDRGKVKLLDQNLQTRQVIQAAISEVKCHVMFVHGYPELVEKNQLSMQTLLAMAEKRGVDTIKEHLQVDELYALQLGALVDARIPIMRHKLKDDACTNIDGYFRLGHKDFAKAKTLTEKLVYIYAMKFDVNNNATPVRNRPYQGEILILLISNQLFHSSRAIGMKFASRFVEIAKNKSKRPEIPIPFLALVATAVVYSALLWKSLGSPGKFNFSGNQFSEVYSYHVKSLEQLKHDAPGKFHYMMADIYEAAHKLKRNGATGDHIELNTFELLDLEGMEED
ncbi:uncharacterized protein EDB91DRAFT_1078969 [Suillus paluster]|uniref:uncharacterized protein n=1 Tax=Suillus paluster TaxID=48578 RepID=UPI001B885EEE|nr:uncharacterized protein EDB91DRAFT_1078969 [Suillus paluster]KAG1748821.1 hypothetical protein EDB91DRAFT_1078969 [Suillus paluster]